MDLLPRTDRVECLAKDLSDHSPLLVKLSIGGLPTLRLWKLNPYLLPVMGDHNGGGARLQVFMLINAGTGKRVMVWESMKAFLRCLHTANIAKIKRKSRKEEASLSQTEEDNERQYIKDQLEANICRFYWKVR